MHEPIQVFEHATLRVGEQGFTEPAFERLVGFNERHGNRYFAVGNRRLHFTQYVGVIQVGRTAIEILPKVDGVPGAAEGELWRGVLLEMLRRCGLFRVEAPTWSHLDRCHASLLDLHLEAFLGEVEALVHSGLVKRYRRTRENLGVFKGRLLVAQQIRHNLIHRERAFCEYTAYDRDSVFNRLLREALRVVRDTAVPARLADEAKRLLLAFDGLAEAAATAETFRRLHYDRNTERYRRALALAELILLNYAPDTRHGNHSVLAILLDMNLLFERYVFRELQRAARVLPVGQLRVRGQLPKRFWQAEDTHANLRPDIVAELGAEAVPRRLVIDTKWKLPADRRPTGSDLQQMYAYNLQFGATDSVLLYPQTGASACVCGEFMTPGTDQPAANCRCSLWFADVVKDGRLDVDFGTRLAERLLALVPVLSVQ